MSDTRFVAVEQHNRAVGPYAAGWSWKCCAYPCREMGSGFETRKEAGAAGSAHIAAVHPEPVESTQLPDVPDRARARSATRTEGTAA